MTEWDKGKKLRYRKFVKQLQKIANEYSVSGKGLARMLSDLSWRELYEWVESSEFLSTYAYIKPKKNETNIRRGTFSG
jgi:hypothetical protein